MGGLQLDDPVPFPGRSDAAAIAVRGALDGNTAPVLQAALFGAFERGLRFVVLDLSGVKYLGSICDAILVKFADHLNQRGGGLAVCRVPSKVTIVLRMLGFDRFLAIAEDADTALASLLVTADRRERLGALLAGSGASGLEGEVVPSSPGEPHVVILRSRRDAPPEPLDDAIGRILDGARAAGFRGVLLELDWEKLSVFPLGAATVAATLRLRERGANAILVRLPPALRGRMPPELLDRWTVDDARRALVDGLPLDAAVREQRDREEERLRDLRARSLHDSLRARTASPGLVARLLELFREPAGLQVRVVALEGERPSCVVEVQGPFDDRLPELWRRAVAAARKQRVDAFALDLSAAKDLGPRAFGFLIRWAEELERDGGTLALVNVETEVRAEMERLDLGRFFVIGDNLAWLREAVRRATSREGAP